MNIDGGAVVAVPDDSPTGWRSTQGPARLMETAGAASRIGFEVIASAWRRRTRIRWGTIGDEPVRALPGDGLIASPRWSSTHAVAIRASPEQVWPWVAQLGQGRGGLYSYERLENLLGCQIRNTDRIIDEFQDPQVGHEIRLHPKAPAIPIRIVDRVRALVLGGMVDGVSGYSWAFVIEPVGHNRSRLLVRGRAVSGPSLLSRLSFGPWLMEPIAFVMETKMLSTIAALAERSAAEGACADDPSPNHAVSAEP